MMTIEQRCRVVVDELAWRLAGRLPISPSALTVSGMLLNIPAAVLLACGYLPWAAGVMLVAAAFDVADGALARATNQQSPLGAFLDSTLDRFSEGVIGLGLLVHALRWGSWLDQLLLYLFVSGSLLFSFIRARAEAEGYHAHMGLFGRPLRVLLLAVGLLSGQLRIVLWVLAIGVQSSVMHRLAGVCLEARGGSLAQAARAHPAWLKELRSRWPLRG